MLKLIKLHYNNYLKKVIVSSLIISLIFTALIYYISTDSLLQNILKDYNGIIAGGIALLVAFFTLRQQSQSVEKEIKNQQIINTTNRFLDKKQDTILALGKCRHLIIGLSDLIDTSNFKASDEKIASYHHDLNDQLNLLIFLFSEYHFIDERSNVTYSLLVNAICNISLTKPELNIHSDNHKLYIKELNTTNASDNLTSLKSTLIEYQVNHDLLEKKYCEIYKVNDHTLTQDKNVFLSAIKYNDKVYRMRENNVWEQTKHTNVPRKNPIHSAWMNDKLLPFYWHIYQKVSLHELVEAFEHLHNDILKTAYGINNSIQD